MWEFIIRSLSRSIHPLAYRHCDVSAAVGCGILTGPEIGRGAEIRQSQMVADAARVDTVRHSQIRANRDASADVVE